MTSRWKPSWAVQAGTLSSEALEEWQDKRCAPDGEACRCGTGAVAERKPRRNLKAWAARQSAKPELCTNVSSVRNF